MYWDGTKHTPDSLDSSGMCSQLPMGCAYHLLAVSASTAQVRDFTSLGDSEEKCRVRYGAQCSAFTSALNSPRAVRVITRELNIHLDFGGYNVILENVNSIFNLLEDPCFFVWEFENLWTPMFQCLFQFALRHLIQFHMGMKQSILCSVLSAVSPCVY